MPYPANKPDTTSRIARELERERQQHAMNQESKTGLHDADSDRVKDQRESFERAKARR